MNSLVGQSPPVTSFPANPISSLAGVANKQVDKASSEAMRVILVATELSGKADTTSWWFRNEPLSAFKSMTAEQLVREGRTEAVLAYLQSLEAGAAG